MLDTILWWVGLVAMTISTAYMMLEVVCHFIERYLKKRDLVTEFIKFVGQRRKEALKAARGGV